MGMGDQLVTAGEATPEEQYQWLRLIEKYWLRGVDEAGKALEPDTSNNCSYSLKYDPKIVDYPRFVQMMVKHQSQVKCCSVMQQADTSAYEYQPEEPFGTVGRFFAVMAGINDPEMAQDFDTEHLACASGSCPL
jgi:hypothetical protein